MTNDEIEKSVAQYKAFLMQDNRREDTRVCGLTMSEWQRVIDGGYLCEFKDVAAEKWNVFKTSIIALDDCGELRSDNGCWYSFCRPYRAVGHVQPYFDNGECREYLEELSGDAIVVRHAPGGWVRHIRKGDTGDWKFCDKFIVLSYD